MKKIGIVTDSHSSISPEDAEKLGVWVLPMPFFFGDKCYYEDKDITWEEMMHRLKAGEKVTTSQPSPEAVMEIWDAALSECEEIVYIPISSGLSGACMTATMLSQDEPYSDRVYVVDNGRVATPLYITILDALEMIEKGFSAPQIKEALEKARNDMVIYICVDDLNYLKNGGRIKAGTALLGKVLNIKPILKFDTGLLEPYKNARGIIKARKEMIAAVKEDLQTKFREFYEKGEVNLLAATSAPKEITDEWVKEIEDNFPGMKVLYRPLSMGVSCHIGPGGLGIGISCKPAMHV